MEAEWRTFCLSGVSEKDSWVSVSAFGRDVKEVFGFLTCRSAVDSLVSGLVFPFRTISVLDVKPDTESTSSPASPTTDPEAEKPPLEFQGQLFLKQQQYHLASKRCKHNLLHTTSRYRHSWRCRTRHFCLSRKSNIDRITRNVKLTSENWNYKVYIS